MVKSILFEYGIKWAFYRLLYVLKIKILRLIPATESFYEKKVIVKRVNLFRTDFDQIEDFLSKLNAKDQDELLRVADNAIEGRIRTFSSLDLDYGNPINWHLNPLTGIEENNTTKWFNINDFDSNRGDIKIIWEPSRFTHFLYLARAYMLTKEQRYYEAFSKQLSEWIQENPYSYGVNHKCGQEATLRMLNALITYSTFSHYGLTTRADHEHIKIIVEYSYKKVLSNFFYAHKCVKNNHTLSEITGLIVGAWCTKNEKKLKKAYRLLDKEISSQFLEDGGYIQYSFNYQRFALQILTFVLKISKVTGYDLSDASKKRLEKSCLQLYDFQDSTGDLPNYGSNDGALVFPLSASSYRDFRPVINTINAALCNYRLYDSGNYDEEILWLTNHNYKDLQVKKYERVSKAYFQSGLFSIRHLSGQLTMVLQNFKSRPAQMDQLHVDLWHGGVNVLCDNGTYSYAEGIGKELSLTKAHNTVKLDNLEQMNKKGAFFIYDWSLSKHIEFNDNYFRGTMYSKNNYRHTRKVTRSDNGYIIEDKVTSNKDNFELVFHTPCKIFVKNKSLELFTDNKMIAKIHFDGAVTLDKGYRSLYYMQIEEIHQIIIKNESKTRTKTVIELV